MKSAFPFLLFILPFAIIGALALCFGNRRERGIAVGVPGVIVYIMFRYSMWLATRPNPH